MAAVAFPKDSKTLKLPSGTTYSYVHIPAHPGLPTLLFLHGFPSSCYDWRFQIAHFRAHGYGVLAPDLLGYGETDRPLDAKAYRGEKMASEMVEILDHEGLAVVHGVGHDWGTFLLGRLANYYPERLASAAFLVVGYRPPGEVMDLDGVNAMTKKAVGFEVFGYWRFLEREEAGEIVNKNVGSFSLLSLSKIYRSTRAHDFSHFQFWSREVNTNSVFSSTLSTVSPTAKIPSSGKSTWHRSEPLTPGPALAKQ